MHSPEPTSSLSPRNPDFLTAVAHGLIRHGERDWLGDLLQIDSEAAFCAAIEISLQDAPLFRGRRRAVLLTNWIIDDEGNVHQERLEKSSSALSAKGHIFYADGRSDHLIQEHLARTLRHFANSPALIKQILRFSRPVCHTFAERLVRLSLNLTPGTALTNAHIRKAAFSACLTYLRQSVGSCFATAPALLIQAEQIEYLLNDLYELLSTGRLKRVLEGVEYSVPLSPSFGMGDLWRGVEVIAERPYVFYSPGLLAACRAAELFPAEWPTSKQEEHLRDWLARGEKSGSILEYFQKLILQVYGVSREEWQAFHRRQVLPQRLAIMGRASPRDALCEKVEVALRSFKETFVAFVDHPLLKAWEFTLASFSEGKAEFSRWNLYSSLGLDPSEPGGIGELVTKAIEQKLGDANKKVKELHDAYTVAFDEVRATEGMLRQADSHEKARRLQAEYQSRSYHMQTLLEMRNEAHQKGEQYADMINYLVKQYNVHFPQFFQEIYDAEMFDSKAGPYQDSMAGFRLVYKHGRNDPSQWTMIHEAAQYIESLVDFFKMTETAIASDYPFPEAAQEITNLTDQIIVHVRTPRFLETAMQRMRKAHSPEKLIGTSPDLLTGEKKPWAYISGGTMETLLKIYYRYPGAVTPESRWVESAEDLLVFLLDGLKGLSLKQTERFEKNRKARMLMYSPNHAFALFPGWPGFFAGWQNNAFTYTWVRDFVLNPAKEFYQAILLSPEEQIFLLDEWSKRLPSLVQNQLSKAFISHLATRSVREFVQALASLAKAYLPEELFLAKLDTFLYEMLPLTPGENWKHAMLRIIPERWRGSISSLLDQQPDDLYGYLGSRHLQELAKAYLLLLHRSVQTEVDLHELCAHEAHVAKAAPPAPLMFADTNWPHYHFAFVWGAASERLRLVRLDASGISGLVMIEWESFLKGERKLAWGIYTKLEQYA